MTGHTPAQREYAMLLGLHADDAGYLQWDPDTLLPDLYRWMAPEEREAMAAEFDAHLQATGRLVILECGIHAVLPKLATRPRTGKPVRIVLEEHRRKCLPTQDAPSSDLAPTQTETQVGPDVSVALRSFALLGASADSDHGSSGLALVDGKWVVQPRGEA